MTRWLSEGRLHQLLDRCRRSRVGVIGDLGLDAYWVADMTRSHLSRETPRYPRPVVREEYGPGAGANVAQNLKGLGVGEVIVYSVLGEDWRGSLLRKEMAERDIIVDRLVVSPDRCTTAFVKPILLGYDSRQEDARLDFENATPLAAALEEELIKLVRADVETLDALIVADQLDEHGIVTDDVRKVLNELAAENPDTVFVADSRQRIGLFRDMVLKPNWVEATSAIYPDVDPREIEMDELARVAELLGDRAGRPVFVTMSEKGVLVWADGRHELLPAMPVSPPLDPVGAGDTFISALASALAVGATPGEAGILANLAAAVTVEKLNETGSASPDEILSRYDLAQTEGVAL